ncbi:MAG: hypothetical protein FD181_2830 [Prolixibacteraceae bacterium]|nr:MAG: hypothetical protein FD181_2830 [Prolixibacteraceae bacterium]
MKPFVFVMILVFANVQLSAQTIGKLNVSVATSSAGGNYAPRNIIAIWIEDSSGNFAKTLLANADRRIEYLYTWKAATTAKETMYNRVDAITGATLTSHGTRTCTWNGTDYKKNMVADGTYYVCMELTDKHATGNYSKFAFTKGANNLVTPPNVTGFSSVNIQWEASVTVGIHDIAIDDGIQIFPNPTKNIFHIRGENITSIEILNMSGTLVFKNNSTTRIDMSNYKNGIYLVRIKEGDRTIVKKLVKE